MLAPEAMGREGVDKVQAGCRQDKLHARHSSFGSCIACALKQSSRSQQLLCSHSCFFCPTL